MRSAYACPYSLFFGGGGGGLGGGEGGRESGVSPSGGGVCYILLAGNSARHLCNPRFLGGKSRKKWRDIVIAFKNLFTRWKLVFNYFIA